MLDDDKALKLLLQEANGFFKQDGGYAALNAAIRQMQEQGKEIGDVKALKTEVEKLQAQFEAAVKMVRRSKDGAYLPGAEDMPFNFVKAALACRMGGEKKTFERMKAVHEYEVMREAYDKYGVREKASAMSVADDSSIGLLIPDQVIPNMIVGIYAASAFIAQNGVPGTTRCSVLDNIIGETFRMSGSEGGMVAYWMGEEDTYAESKIKAAEISTTLKKLGVMAKITEEALRLAAAGTNAVFENDAIRAIAAKLDLTVGYGKGGGNVPLGILYTPDVKLFRAEDGKTFKNITDVATYTGNWAGGALTFDVLDNMSLALEEDKIEVNGSFATIFAPRAQRWLAQQKIENWNGQTTQQPYLLGRPMLTAAEIASIIGPFSKSPQISTGHKAGEPITGATPNGGGTSALFSDVFLGNFSEFFVLRRGGIEMVTDDGKGLGFASDVTFMKFRMWAGTICRTPRALAVCADAKIRSAVA